MASIIQRGNKYVVIHSYVDQTGKRKQKWESYSTPEEAEQRAQELEAIQRNQTIQKRFRTVNDLLKEYIALYGHGQWSLSTYSHCVRLIELYIEPFIGEMPLKAVTVHTLEKYYNDLLVTKSASSKWNKSSERKSEYISTATVRKIHNILHSAFQQACKWELMDKNPAEYATLPKHEIKRREIWDADTFFKAVELCTNEYLKMCMHLAFACSMRIGEILALTWDCVDVSQKSMDAGNPSVTIIKEMQRVKKSAMEALNKKDIYYIFPQEKKSSSSVLVMKKPKTSSSIRKVFLPMTVARMLIDWKAKQDREKEMLGSEYHDNNLVIARGYGQPYELVDINQPLKALIKENNLPPVVFHSFRHTSITYKLKLNGGDVKSVQGDSGHSQAQMITERYAHILQEGRVTNAQLLEEAFYQKKLGNSVSSDSNNQSDNDKLSNHELISKILDNPEMIQLLREMMNKIDKEKEA